MIEGRTLLYRIGTIKSCKSDFWYGNVVPYPGFSEYGIVSYCTKLERIGIVTTNSDICDLLTVRSESRSDLLTAVGNFELIPCFRVCFFIIFFNRIMIEYFILLLSYNLMKSRMHANVRKFENPNQWAQVSRSGRNTRGFTILLVSHKRPKGQGVF